MSDLAMLLKEVRQIGNRIAKIEQAIEQNELLTAKDAAAYIGMTYGSFMNCLNNGKIASEAIVLSTTGKRLFKKSKLIKEGFVN